MLALFEEVIVVDVRPAIGERVKSSLLGDFPLREVYFRFNDLLPVLRGCTIRDANIDVPLDQCHVGDLVDLLGIRDAQLFRQISPGEQVMAFSALG